MILKNLAAGTTQSFNAPTLADYWVGISGAGAVAIEFQLSDGTYASYPTGTFTAPTAQVVTMKPGQYRFVVTGGPVTIELAA